MSGHRASRSRRRAGAGRPGGARPVLAASALAAALALFPPPAGAQDVYYVEPMPRREGVRLPPGTTFMNAVAGERLGIPSPASFAAAVDLAAPGPLAVNLAFPPARNVGRRKDILVIPALFSDSPEPHVPVEEIRRVLFDGPADPGTFTEFWAEVSRGRFEARGVVTPWVRTGVTLLEAAGQLEGHGWIGARMRDYVTDAIRLVDPQVDFGQFDNEGPDGVPNSGDDNGIVDALSIEFLEVAGSCGGPAVWPHFGGLGQQTPTGGIEPLATNDLRPNGTPIRIAAYFTESVTDCTGVDLQGPNVIAHEFGHLLGLPDWYQPVEGIEPQNRHWNVGCWGLMGAGSWGCGTGSKATSWGPTHPSALSRYLLGWADLTHVAEGDDREFVLEPVQATGQMLAVRLDPGLPEWFLVEYRPRVGFDSQLPAGGVLVYHYDRFDGAREIPQGLPPAKVYHVVEADGDHALRKVERLGGNRGVAEDAFGLPGSPTLLDASTEPSTRLHLGVPSSVTIGDIRLEDGRARLRITYRPVLVAGPWSVPSPVTVLQGFSAQLTVTGGSPGYQASAQVSGSVPVLDLTTSVGGGTVTLGGRPLVPGRVRVLVVVRDAEGRSTVREAELDAVDMDLPPADLVAGLTVGSPVITQEVRTYLDRAGNEDGAYDLGDLRAYVLRKAGG